MGKRTIFCALLLLLCALLPASAALAADGPALWVDGLGPEGLEGEGIGWWYSERAHKHYLFLPAAADATGLRVHLPEGEEASVDGAPLQDGQATGAFLPGAELTVRIGKREYPLQVMQSAHLPAMFIQTENGTLDAIHAKKEHKETGLMLLVDAEGNVLYDGELRQLKGRGNATFKFDKKPYQIKLEDKTDLLGMGEARTWVLLASYNDYSLLRNQITFDMARAVGLPYTPEGQNIDLYIDGEYRGTYLLSEKIEIDPERVDIYNLEKANEEANDQPPSEYPTFGRRNHQEDAEKGYDIPIDPPDISGGYLLEFDYPVRYNPEASGFVTHRGQAVVIKEPEFASQAQVSYIHGLMQSLENALRADDGADPETGRHYSEIIDMDSFIKKYLVEEVVKNYDGNKSSLYFFKPRDQVSPLLFAGPVWDYDSALGNYAPEHNPKFSTPQNLSVGVDMAQPYYIFSSAYSHQDFYEAAVEAYYAEFVPVLEALLGRGEHEGIRSIDELAVELAYSAEMNFARWPIFKRGSHPVDTGANLAENIDYLKNFISERMAFLAETWPRE